MNTAFGGLRLAVNDAGVHRPGPLADLDIADAQRHSGGHRRRRAATTKEIADTVLWLLSAGATFAVGHDLVIDGGASI